MVVGDEFVLLEVEVKGYCMMFKLCYIEVLLVKVFEEKGIGCFLMFVIIFEIIFDCGYVVKCG